MTSTRGDSKTPPGGNDAWTSIRSLDPVDPNASPPDGSRLLQALLATPRPTSRRRRGVRMLQLAPVVALALGAGVVAVLASGGERGEEREAVGGSGGTAIIHYVVRESWSAPDGSRQPAFTHERWQLEDGSRARTISHWEGEGPLQGKTSEDIVTSTQTLSYAPASDTGPERIIRYRSSDDFAAIPDQDPPTFAAPPIGGSPAVGDPRTVPGRLADGDADVTQLADATVRDTPVRRFQVGDCGEATSGDRKREPGAVATVPQRAVVALARDTLTPVRVTYEPCSSDQIPGDTRVLDYTSFEELPQTPENLELLELSSHPGVPVVDGIEIDKAEERDESVRTPRPTPTPQATPVPRDGTSVPPQAGQPTPEPSRDVD